MNALVSVIIVNWNAKANLEECLNSLFKITYSPFEVVVVDNGSSDGSVALVKKKFPAVKVVEANRNLGFAEANNLGYKKSKGDYILFLNNDCIATENFLSKLVNFSKNNSTVGVVQPIVIFYRPGTPLHNKINSVGSFLIRNGFLYHQDYGQRFTKKKYHKPYEVFSAYGACFLTKREIIEDVGLFDKDYFVYFEETDFCHRVWLSGHSVFVYPFVKVFHKGAETSNKMPISFIQYHSFKNKLYSYLKNLNFYYILTMFFPHFLLCEASSLLYILFKKPEYFFAIQKAIIWNIKNYKKILKERKKVQRNIRRFSDSSFIPKLTKSVNLKYYYYLSKAELDKYN